MAETIATELIKVIFRKLSDEVFKRIVRSQGIHTELKELKRTLSRIQNLLSDASEKEVTTKSVKQWLNDLQCLAYDIDDLLDDLSTEAMHRELTPESRAITSKVRKLIPTCCTNFSLSHRLSPKLDSINRELQYLEKQKSDLGLIVKDEKPKSTSRRNETSLPDASRVVGREGEIQKLLTKLLGGESSKENFSIVPIVGMGGVGKTTLARLLYNHTEVKGHFQLRSWVCISDDFDIFKISNTILQSVTKENKENKEYNDLNQLQMALTMQFKDKRFLLVVDDVWNENDDDWENLVRPFHSCAPGSRIIMTTRKEQLLKMLGFDHLDRLESLSHEDAICLFALHALGVDNFDSHTTLKPQVEGIVKKCAGLPLALKAIGRLLRTRTHVEDWDDVLNNEIWNLENTGKIVPALRLSYEDLSADLKQLFAYCSLFPKGFVFNKEELVLLWMAEGFLNPSDATKLPERLGHKYFEILLSRSFFQHAPNDESLFIMHDLMVDLATFVAGDFFLRFENHVKKGKEALAKNRYMSFTREEYVGHHKFEEFKRARSLRTILAVYIGVHNDWQKFYLSNKILIDLLPKLQLLRVLSLSCFEIIEVPESIGMLKHLRYLNLSKTKIKELPESVGNLYNLQTLLIFGCKSLTKLPESFLKLKRLRHFDNRDTPLLKKLPLGIADLESIQTLSKITIGGHDGLAINELKGLKNLHGKISIQGLHKVQSAMHAREANLSLRRIIELQLQWGIGEFDSSLSSALEKDVLSELEPNRNSLKNLVIVSYGGRRFSNWVGDPSFHELVEVSIRGCRRCTYLPPFGKLPLLKKLSIQGMDEVKEIGLELSGTGEVAFPSLETLKFKDMLGWEVWSTNSKIVFPCLLELCIRNCGNLVDISLATLPSLRVLDIDTCGNGVLKGLVKACPSITELRIMSISGLTYEVWRGVVKYLKAVEYVGIWGCHELRYLWESEGEASKVLRNLRKLYLSDCSTLVSLGERNEEDNFGSNLLSSLRMLEISVCNNMERCFCPNSSGIESLKIYWCRSFTHVIFPAIATTGGEGGQKLKSFVIYGCYKVIMEKINNINMPMLEVLDISNWKNLKSIVQLGNRIHLTRLSIFDCGSLQSLPDLSNLTLLQHLGIVMCGSMDYSFPCGVWPPNLCSLEIGGLKNPISEWGLQNYPASLVDFTIDYEVEVSNFSQLSHVFPSSLTQLSLKRCDNLESLSTGLQHLESLQRLDIWRCEKIIDLPETLLPSLLSLRMDRCSNLKKRCNGRGSHYWPLISHIPRIQIE